MFIVSPSIYSGDFLHLAEQLDALAGLENLHLDIDDGNFVHDISFGTKIVEAIASYTKIPLDAHLEVLNPLEYVQPLCKIGVKQICAHIERLPFPSHFLSAVHKNGTKAGLSLNLKTPVLQLEPFIDQLDYVLLVSVEADYDGLCFRPGVLKKIKDARRLLPKTTQIWVDGGINKENFAEVVKAGADAVVLGRAIFETPSPRQAWQEFRDEGEVLSQIREKEG